MIIKILGAVVVQLPYTSGGRRVNLEDVEQFIIEIENPLYVLRTVTRLPPPHYPSIDRSGHMRPYDKFRFKFS